MPGDGGLTPATLWASVRETDFRALALALTLGTVGGAVFNALNLPLPWMLGAMRFTSIAAIAGVGIAVPMGLRSTMVVILGVMLGSAFDPGILENIGRWAVSLTGLAVYILVCIALGIAYLRLIARYDPITAFFTATPGGFNEMVLIGGAMGADDRTIAMSHSARVILVVFTIPLLFQAFGGLDPAARAALNATEIDIAPRDLGLLAGCDRDDGPLPVVGTLAGVVAGVGLGAASTWALGQLFQAHFEEQGTLEDFDPDQEG